MKVYEVSGSVFQRNEFLRGTNEYERQWEIVGAGQHITNDPNELERKIRAKNPEQNNQYGLVEIRDLRVEYVCEFQLGEDGKAPLCGDNPDGSHWTWFGNHEPNCPHARG